MIRPLYLDAALHWQVGLDDGPALNVAAPGRARSLFPLQRLARVISPAHAQWSTAALLACLRAGVPVVFHDAAGEPVAWCFGPRKRETTLGSLLRLALEQPKWERDLADWRVAAERHEILRTFMALQLPPGRLEAAAVRVQLCNWHRLCIGSAAGPWLRALRRSASALTAERLHDLVGDPALIGFARAGLHLGQWFDDLLEWRLHLVLHAAPRRAFAQGAPGRFAAEAIERESAELHRGLGELAGRLEHHLRGALT